MRIRSVTLHVLQFNMFVTAIIFAWRIRRLAIVHGRGLFWASFRVMPVPACFPTNHLPYQARILVTSALSPPAILRPPLSGLTERLWFDLVEAYLHEEISPSIVRI